MGNVVHGVPACRDLRRALRVQACARDGVEKPLLAPESHRHQTRHVKRRAGRGDRSDDPNQPADRNVSGRRRAPENFIFGPETAERNDAADRQPAREESQVGVGHVLLKPAHTPHVLLVMHAVNHAAGAEEHQRLEKCVGHHMEDANRKSAHAAGHEHETELRNGRVSQNFLDVVLRDADRGGKQCRGRAHHRHHHHHRLRMLEDDVGARHHVETGGNHRRGMDQSRNRSWTSHRIRQPNVQRKLGRLAAGADEKSRAQSTKAVPSCPTVQAESSRPGAKTSVY